MANVFQQIGAVTKMDVKGPAGIARPGANGVEARRVETVLGELRERRRDQRLPRFLLGF